MGAAYPDFRAIASKLLNQPCARLTAWSLLLYLFGSGGAFWLGAAMVLAGFGCRVFGNQKWLDRAAVYTVDIGLVLVVLSAVPLSLPVYLAIVGSTVLWLVVDKSQNPSWHQCRPWVRSALLGSWLLTLALELPYQFTPSVPTSGGQIFVIGDSITAGLGDKIVTWPQLLADERGFTVLSQAAAGATISQALIQTEKLPDRADVILIEIGGNDLLSQVPIAQFERDLDKLLSGVRQRSDHVIMFELPLPPLCNEYGHIQRRLSAKHDVRLAPKRLLMGVLASSTATSDTIHLTQSGHARLAQIVSGMIH